MKILIVGCGKVGASLAEQLNQEGHEITLIDNKASVINNITDVLDVMGIVGNGTSYHTLLEAGIEEADLMIAVTHSDELNLLCCLIAKKAGNCHTIARVRNPQYREEIDFIKEELGLSMTINPELETATDMAHLIKIPSAIKVDPFANGRAELRKFQIPKDCVLNNMKIMNMNRQLHCKVLVCAVEREEKVYIPSGDFALQNDDKVSIVATPKGAVDFFTRIGITSRPIKNTLLVGGGNLTVYLTNKLTAAGVKVRIIEQNKERCEELSNLLPEALIINANASDSNILLEEGITEMDAFAALTNLDEENIFLSLYVQKISKAKIYTKITRLSCSSILDDMPLGCIINPKLITAERILQHVRAMQNSYGSNVETLYKIVENKVEALEFRVRSNFPFLGVPLEKLNLKNNILVSCINRRGNIIIPNGQDSIQSGDTVIIVTTNIGLNDFSDILS